MRNGCPHNPFSVHRLGPENIAYRFSEDDCLERLVSVVAAAGWCAELVGPHGAGKSTLLHTLAGAARARSSRVRMWRCAEGRPALPVLWRWRLHAADLCFLDSAERAPSRSLAALMRHCQRRGVGLVFTAHHPKGWGLHVAVEATPGQFLSVVRSVAVGEAAPDAAALERLLADHAGNAREALFALYDGFESRGALTASPR